MNIDISYIVEQYLQWMFVLFSAYFPLRSQQKFQGDFGLGERIVYLLI